MTLDELIEKLTQMRDEEGGDTIVVVRGYESGYDRAEGGHEKWWDGRYDESAFWAHAQGTDPVHVVHLVSATDKTFD